MENKITDHDCSNTSITTPEFNKLTAENFAAKLKTSKFSQQKGYS